MAELPTRVHPCVRVGIVAVDERAIDVEQRGEGGQRPLCRDC
jgi:hypothetical protein